MAMHREEQQETARYFSSPMLIRAITGRQVGWSSTPSGREITRKQLLSILDEALDLLDEDQNEQDSQDQPRNASNQAQ